MTEAITEALKGIRKQSLCRDHGFVAFLLRRDLEYSSDDSIDTACWLCEHPDHAEIWIAANAELEPSVSFDELLDAETMGKDWIYCIKLSPGQPRYWMFQMRKPNYSRFSQRFIGKTESEARTYWHANGYAILYPIING